MAVTKQDLTYLIVEAVDLTGRDGLVVVNAVFDTIRAILAAPASPLPTAQRRRQKPKARSARNANSLLASFLPRTASLTTVV
ncbi:hypothetical protein BBC27_05195 [Acidithiobacillus ferrivorans]|nr:hypothetical protein [Acidithiobacillus ferrivorans]OCB04018.1 hypothetical protein BBC27_05195 [Acidithiobacillus ferrivorans]